MQKSVRTVKDKPVWKASSVKRIDVKTEPHVHIDPPDTIQKDISREKLLNVKITVSVKKQSNGNEYKIAGKWVAGKQ